MTHMKGRTTTALLFLTAFCFCAPGFAAARPEADSAGFLVKYVLDGSVYIGSGSTSGLEEGQKLSVRRLAADEGFERSEKIGEIEIETVTPLSAAGKILFEKPQIAAGDVACVDSAPAGNQLKQESARLAFNAQQTNGPEGEAGVPRASSRKPAASSRRTDNRVRGRVGVDYSAIQVMGSDAKSSQFGFMLRLDASRIAGTHWNAQGYYRGRFQTRTTSAGQETLNDLINRTYQLNASYENPESSWVAGIGRLYLPWASSLDTMDGLYVGRKFGRQTAGFFMGTAPDPTSWNYSPDRRLGGVFYNVEGGSFESLRYDSTAGIALSWRQWRPDRKFGFFENNFFYKRYLSVYSSIEADLLSGEQNGGRNEAVLSRSAFTVRIQPDKRVSFNVNHNYFRNIPTFDTRLIGTGLLDDYLFQGVSGGVRFSLPYNIRLHGNTGRSSRTGDRKASWNYLAGASISDIWNTGLRAGFRFSRFDSSFGRGTYQSLSLSREIAERLQFEVQGGQQNFKSIFTNQDRARFVNGSVDCSLGRQVFLGGGVTVYRGQVQDYNQFFLRLGYRFDNFRGR
jgi:hypothetical protein